MTDFLVTIASLCLSVLVVAAVVGVCTIASNGRTGLTLPDRVEWWLHALYRLWGRRPTIRAGARRRPITRLLPTRKLVPVCRGYGQSADFVGHISPYAATAVLGESEWFGPYRLESLLGQGAMGQVWRAFDTRRHRNVALKLLPNNPALSTRARDRMQREALLVGALSCAHVIPVHDFGHIAGTTFLDMRLVTGGDLAQLLREHPHGLDPHRALAIVSQIAAALDAAHDAGVIHCDVKPSNVLLERSASSDFCYLADFGIAALADPLTDPTARPGATVCGTPTYMAPELFTAADAASSASDVYALAVLAHELLVGRPPFDATALGALFWQHRHDNPPELDLPHTPATSAAAAALSEVLRRALAKEPHRRHSSAGALAAALHHALTATAPASGSASTPPPSEPSTTPDPSPADADSLDAIFIPGNVATRRPRGRRRPRAA